METGCKPVSVQPHPRWPTRGQRGVRTPAFSRLLLALERPSPRTADTPRFQFTRVACDRRREGVSSRRAPLPLAQRDYGARRSAPRLRRLSSAAAADLGPQYCRLPPCSSPSSPFSRLRLPRHPAIASLSRPQPGGVGRVREDRHGRGP
jgi:hypothetical protein